MATKKKLKKLSNQQKINVFDSIEDNGADFAVSEGYLDDLTKGTVLEPYVKAYKKAQKEFNAKTLKLGLTSDEIEDLKDKLAAEEEEADQEDGDEGDDGTF